MSSPATSTATPGITPSLGWFVSMSLLLHLALLWGVTSPETTTLGDTGQERETRLVLHLQQHREAQPEPTPPAPLPQAKPVAAPPSPSKREPKPKVTARKKPAATPVQHTASPTNIHESEAGNTAPQSSKPVATTTAVANNNKAALQERLRITLQQALADHFTYPLMARRHGWQGRVVLSFRLETDGRILDARIARSSGYGVLDHAALTALGKVKYLETSLSHSLTMQLPVIYRLEG